MQGSVGRIFCDVAPDDVQPIEKIIPGDGFDVIVLKGKDEHRVRARLAGAADPDYLYGEFALRMLEEQKNNHLSDIALYARMAVIRTKSKLGFLKPKYQAIPAATGQEDKKIIICGADFSDALAGDDAKDPNGHFKDYAQGRSIAAREDKWRDRAKVPMGQESRFDLDYDS